MSIFNKMNRVMLNCVNRIRLKNYTPSIISCNCIGGVMLHDLGLEFRTPTINLFFSADDYLRYIENMSYYNSQQLHFISVEEVDYPVALCGDIYINFMHYHSVEEAEKKWFERIKKIDENNMFYIFSDLSEGCTYDHLVRFDKLETKNKVVFTGLKYDKIESAVYIPGFEDQGHVGNIIPYKNKFTGKRFYEDFDYVAWLNGSL